MNWTEPLLGDGTVGTMLASPEDQDGHRKGGGIVVSGECTGPWGPDEAAAGGSSAVLMRSVGATSLRDLQRVPAATLLRSPAWGTINAAVDGYFLLGHPDRLPLTLRGGAAVIGGNTISRVAAFNSTMAYWFGPDAGEITALYPPAQAFIYSTRDTGVSCPARWLAEKLHEAGNRVYMYEYGWGDGNTTWPFAGQFFMFWSCGYVWQQHPYPGTDPSADDRHVSDVLAAYSGAFLHLNVTQAAGEMRHQTCVSSPHASSWD
eukprot:gene45415-23202_t